MTNKKSNGIVLYVRTSKKNYILNILISLGLAIVLTYWIYLLGWSDLYIPVGFFLSFMLLFRMGEYLLTGKSLALYLFDYADKGNKALYYFILHFILLIILIISLLMATPK